MPRVTARTGPTASMVRCGWHTRFGGSAPLAHDGACGRIGVNRAASETHQPGGHSRAFDLNIIKEPAEFMATATAVAMALSAYLWAAKGCAMVPFLATTSLALGSPATARLMDCLV